MSQFRSLGSLLRLSYLRTNHVLRTGCIASQRSPVLFAPNNHRSIATSSGKSDDSAVTKVTSEPGGNKNQKPWLSYDFSDTSEEMDQTTKNNVFFTSITLLFVLGGFIIMYYPDRKMVDWSHREAYIRLAIREAQGLPPIDENLIPPEEITLPSDEELGDFEIVI